MGKTILAVNAGSSSVKITFYTFENPPKAIADEQVSGITSPPSTLKYQRGAVKHKEQLKEQLSTPQDAFKFLLSRCFNDPELSEVASDDDLAYICHRVVHGGDYHEAVTINDETYHHLKELEDLAPLYVAWWWKYPFQSLTFRIYQTQLLGTGNHPSLQTGTA
jgi:acetate kinase